MKENNEGGEKKKEYVDCTKKERKGKEIERADYE